MMKLLLFKGDFFWIAIFSLAFCDQLTKILAVRHLKNSLSVPVLPSIFHLTLIHNRGAAFGLFPHFSKLLIAISCLLFLFFFLYRAQILSEKTPVILGYIFLGGGALGNMLDRLRLGSVIDFLDFLIWPIFNCADVFICIGVFLLSPCFLFYSKKD